MNQLSATNQDQTRPESESANPAMASDAPATPKPTPSRRKLYLLTAAIITVIALGLAAYFISANRPHSQSNQTAETNQPQASASATPTTTPAPTTTPTPTLQSARDCGSLASFADKQAGFSFCYPQEWGQAALKDAKVDPSDAGHRQMVTFSTNSQVSVGGQSQDWSTTVGRGVGCLEPNNAMPSLSDYNTDWHSTFDDGMGMFYSIRSLPSQQGGYALEESISVGADASGWCVKGYKVINGSRYQVAHAAFHSNKAMLSTLAANQNAANQFFTPAQRNQFDALLASLQAF